MSGNTRFAGRWRGRAPVQDQFIAKAIDIHRKKVTFSYVFDSSQSLAKGRGVARNALRVQIDPTGEPAGGCRNSPVARARPGKPGTKTGKPRTNAYERPIDVRHEVVTKRCIC